MTQSYPCVVQRAMSCRVMVRYQMEFCYVVSKSIEKLTIWVLGNGINDTLINQSKYSHFILFEEVIIFIFLNHFVHSY